MSFFEGVVMCFFAGYLNSYLYSKYLRKKNRTSLFWFAALFLTLAMTIDMMIFFNVIDAHLLCLPWVSIPKGVDPGKYWMFTPGLMIGFPLELPVRNYNGIVWLFLAIFFLISYVWWFTIGQNLGRFMFGRLEYEQGAWYLMRSTKMVKRSQEKLEKKQQGNK